VRTPLHRMSLPPDHTPPTRPVPPATVPVRSEAAYVRADDVVWREDVRARLRSLTTALTIAIAVAFIALGVAIYALLADADGDGGANPEQVRALQQRVDRLEALAGRGASQDAVAALREQQRALAARVAALQDDVAQPAEGLESLQTAIDGTQQAIDQLDERISALEQAAPAP
jgi:hypothetical protein